MSPAIDEFDLDAEPARRRFTVDEFQRMGEAGIFAPDERVELIDGEVIEMTPIGPRHNWSVIDLIPYFSELRGDDLLLAVQCAIEIGNAQPKPDFMLLRARGDRVRDRLPQPEACVLIVEISDSSAWFDREEKNLLYAAGGIPEYWGIDLPRNTVVVHRRPESGIYREIADHPRGTSFASAALGGREICVDDLLV